MLQLLSNKSVSRYVDNHVLVEAIDDKDFGVKGFVAVHRGNKSRPAFGATRLWIYDQDKAALNEALQLSRLMSYKAAMAGIQYGGGKAVLMLDPNLDINRKEYFSRYAEFVNQLEGLFVTGADVGLFPDDVNYMRTKSNFIVGAYRDPVYFTTLGIESAIRSVFHKITQSDNPKDLSIAIQGLGKIGMSLLERIYHPDSTIYITDTNPVRVALAQEKFPGVIYVDPGVIHKQKVLIFSPNAMSHSISDVTINELECRAVVGGANNQLQRGEFASVLHEKGVLYAPDYVVNAGGLMSVVDEYEFGEFPSVGLEARAAGIGRVLESILEESILEKISPLIVSNKKAEAIINKYE